MMTGVNIGPIKREISLRLRSGQALRLIAVRSGQAALGNDTKHRPIKREILGEFFGEFSPKRLKFQGFKGRRPIIRGMLQALEYYQSLAQKFQSQLLTGPGIIIVMTGVCIWLAGLRWRRIIGALVGIMVAAAGVFVIGKYPFGSAQGWPLNIVIIACATGLLCGVIINRIVFGIFGAAVGAGLIILMLAGGLTAAEIQADNFASDYGQPTWPEYEQKDIVIDTRSALQITNEMAQYFIDKAKKAAAASPVLSISAAALTAVIAIAVALILPRLFIAAASSSLGCAMIFFGTIMLCLYKGQRPISSIAHKGRFYAIVFTAMMIFGMIVQLILSPAAKVKPAADEEKGVPLESLKQ